MKQLFARSRRRGITMLFLVLVTALLASGCKFNGAYDLPIPAGAPSRGDAYQVTADFSDALNVVPRTEITAVGVKMRCGLGSSPRCWM